MCLVQSPAFRRAGLLFVSVVEPLVPTLDTLKDGQIGRIRDVVGDDVISVRLMEMGLTDGEVIEFVGRAPLGDPIEFEVRGYRLSLRAEEARRVLIDLTD